MAVIYEMMPHPPRNMAAQDFRSVDGADRLGAAYMPYAQSVIAGPKSKIAYPDAQEVFDRLMLRKMIDGKEKVSFLPWQYHSNLITMFLALRRLSITQMA